MPPTLYPGAGLPLVSKDLHAHKFYAIGAHEDCFGSASDLLPVREVFMMALMDACKSLEARWISGDAHALIRQPIRSDRQAQLA